MILLVVFTTLSLFTALEAKNPYRRAFFDTYPAADGTQLNSLPSNSSHCGVCHFDFDGSAQRNAYGLKVEIGLNSGLSVEQAILAIENEDSDGDGFTNLTEITDTATFSNTPTFPGLNNSNYTMATNVSLGDIDTFLVPSGSTDHTPPTVTVFTPNGGETFAAHATTTVTWLATDDHAVDHVEVLLSDDGGSEFEVVGSNLPHTGSFSWFVPNLPGTASRIRVEAYDVAGNDGHDDSDADFTITAAPGLAPTTLRDMKLPGTQPHEGAILEDPAGCASCHGGYDPAVEPYSIWQGSMMAQAMRDPLFLACMAVAEQDAPSVGDVCIRCHTPGGWQEGRSADTSGGMVNAKDRAGVQCDFCHRLVDYNYVGGVSPIEDLAVLDEIDPLPTSYANGMFINDPAPVRRGPLDDAQADHEWLYSPFHRRFSDICGTCHDVSNPVYVRVGPQDYALNGFDEEHPDMDVRNMFPIERTYSEWTRSAFPAGVYAPQFAGTKPDGVVSTCADCHMRDVAGKTAVGGPNRTDLGLHDFTGGNTFIGDILAEYFPTEVDQALLDAGTARARSMLQLAARLELTPTPSGLTVRVYNDTGHKLPSGYPEGRRIWLNVRAVDIFGQTVFESGAYDLATAELGHDDQAKIYEIKPGFSPGLAAALGMPAGPSFHFVLNDTIWSDNRIPPQGFTNAGFETIQSPVVAHTYADGQYWDDTDYLIPAAAETAHVTLYYQTTSKEYVEFLRDENTTNSAGQDLYDSWVAQGKNPPELMAQASTPLEITVSGTPGGHGPRVLALAQNAPNPFAGGTRIEYDLPQRAPVRIDVFDLSGRLVRRLVDRVEGPGTLSVTWNGRGSEGEPLAGGIYFIRLTSGNRNLVKRAVLLQ